MESFSTIMPVTVLMHCSLYQGLPCNSLFISLFQDSWYSGTGNLLYMCTSSHIFRLLTGFHLDSKFVLTIQFYEEFVVQ